MFTPKKNRNIRKKIDLLDEDTPTDSAVTTPIDNGDTAEPAVVKPKKVKKKAPATVLSFGDEEEDTEVFKVKKSAASRRLAHAKGKDPTDLDQPAITSRATVGNSTSYSKEALDELKRATQSKTVSSVEEKFPSLLGGPTIIPDENAIYLARKKREQMRMRNDQDEEEFISLTGGNDDTVEEQRNTRLVREEDDEMDDGEEEFEQAMGEKFALGNRAERVAEQNRRAAKREMIEDVDEDDEDEEESREWEMQQIRNAGVVKKDPIQTKGNQPKAMVHRTIAFPTAAPVPSLIEVRRRLEQQMSQLKLDHDMHTAQLDSVRDEEANLVLEAVEVAEELEKASAQYTTLLPSDTNKGII